MERKTMKAMILKATGPIECHNHESVPEHKRSAIDKAGGHPGHMDGNHTGPLVATELPVPRPSRDEILIKVTACGVCHTELDIIEGRTPPGILPLIPGHQVIGHVVEKGSEVKKFRINDRVGVAWIFSSCLECDACRSGKENLCERFIATGRDANGGYAEYMVAKENFAVKIPDNIEDIHAAPLLCAGAVGYRSLRLAGIKNGSKLGFTGFGASAHLVLQAVKYIYPDSELFVFARNPHQRAFALQLKASWAGDTTDRAPVLLDAVIDTTPAWKPVIYALENLKPAGRLVINAIRKENTDKEILGELDYARHLWMEKTIISVANVCRNDVSEFLDIAVSAGIKPETQTYSLLEANRALYELKSGKIKGAKVLVI